MWSFCSTILQYNSEVQTLQYILFSTDSEVNSLQSTTRVCSDPWEKPGCTARWAVCWPRSQVLLKGEAGGHQYPVSAMVVSTYDTTVAETGFFRNLNKDFFKTWARISLYKSLVDSLQTSKHHCQCTCCTPQELKTILMKCALVGWGDAMTYMTWKEPSLLLVRVSSMN